MSGRLVKPRALRRGDRIAVVAPSGCVDGELLERGLQALRSRGLEPCCGPHVRDRHFYMAGSDAARAADLFEAFENPDVAAVFCARGGAGALRLMNRLPADIFARNPKIFLGSSDITALLLFLMQTCGMVVFHGPMVAGDFARQRVDDLSLSAIFDQNFAGRSLRPRMQTLHAGRARGRLSGGCLSLLVALEGTRYAIDTENCLLFLEDIAARPYQVERMLTQLRLAGKFDGVRGLIFGEMRECQPAPGSDYTLQDLIGSVVGDLNIPIVFGFPSGHVNAQHCTLPFGIEATLDTATGSLTLEESAVQ